VAVMNANHELCHSAGVMASHNTEGGNGIRNCVLSDLLQDVMHGVRFQTEIYTRGCHWIPRLLRLSLVQACDQWPFLSGVNCLSPLPP
jgi:hypothetical protein